MLLPVLLKLLAILSVVALGYVAGRMRWLGGTDPARVLGHAAFYIFVPALLFRTTARIELSRLPWHTLGAFFGPLLLSIVLVYVACRRRARHGDPPAGPGVQSITACFGNTVQMGIPMALAMFGEAGLRIHVAIVSLHALTALTLLTALAETDLARERIRQGLADGQLGRILLLTARKTIIHPVVLPILAGLGWNVLSLPQPGLLDEVLVQLGQAVVPLCLVLIGLSLAYYGLKGSVRGALLLSAIKLLGLPLLVLLVGHGLLGMTGLPLAVVVMAAALPTGNNALIFAQRYETGEAEATATIVLSTFGFAVTGPAWLAVLSRFP